jgi:hypothetical protein
MENIAVPPDSAGAEASASKSRSGARGGARASIRRLSLLDDEIADLEKSQLMSMRSSVSSVASRGTAGGRGGDERGPVALEAQGSTDEPAIHSRADVPRWVAWAKDEAALAAAIVHPHRVRLKDRATRRAEKEQVRQRTQTRRRHGGPSLARDVSARTLGADGLASSGEIETAPLSLRSSHDVMMGALGSGVRLYFDFLLLLAGFAFLGAALSIPSYLASHYYLHGDEYDQHDER